MPRPIVPGLAAEREATIARLQDAAAASDDDAFDMDMLEERLELAMKARTVDELRVLTRDLPATTAQIVVPPARAPVPAVVDPTRARDDARDDDDVDAPRMTAIFSSTSRRGRRAQPRMMKLRAVFGSVELDLREATFQPGVTTVKCSSVFGSVEIKVPPHVRVELAGSGVFGAFDEVGSNDLAEVDPDAPVLRVLGKAVFASVEVICRKRKDKTRALPNPAR